MSKGKQPVAKQCPSKRVAMAEAVCAYIRGEELSLEERKRLIAEARVKTSLRQAIKLTFVFARGYIDDPWSLKNLRALTRAWLRLGESVFHLIYRWVRPRDSEPSGNFRDLIVRVFSLRTTVVV